MSFFTGYIKKCSHNITNKTNEYMRFFQVCSQNAHKRNTALSKLYLGKKRTSPCLRGDMKLAAGVSVEAALAIPLFIYVMANLMMLILMFKDYSVNLSDAQQTARSIALISNEPGGYSDIITIQKPLTVKALFSEVGFPSAFVSADMKYRKWNGYDVCGETGAIEEDEYVYVTEYGSVYHMDRGCSHLMINLHAVTDVEIADCRNNNMEKYYPCEKCGGNGTGIVFITEEGNRYHSSATCSGIKREVRTVKLSEVGNLPACSTCGR